MLRLSYFNRSPSIVARREDPKWLRQVPYQQPSTLERVSKTASRQDRGTGSTGYKYSATAPSQGFPSLASFPFILQKLRYELTHPPAIHMPNLKCTCPRSQTAVFPKTVPVLISYTRMEPVHMNRKRFDGESNLIRWDTQKLAS